eukprot:21357-Heterococcus_DN1.PRE.2
MISVCAHRQYATLRSLFTAVCVNKSAQALSKADLTVYSMCAKQQIHCNALPSRAVNTALLFSGVLSIKCWCNVTSVVTTCYKRLCFTATVCQQQQQQLRNTLNPVCISTMIAVNTN